MIPVNRIFKLAYILLILALVCGCNLPAVSISTEPDTKESIDEGNTPIEIGEQNTQSNNAIIISPTADATNTPTITPTPTYFPSPTSTPIPLEALPKSKCASIAVDMDVTVKDGTIMKPGEIFTKVWRITNIGSCAWDSNFKLIFHKGDKMSGPDEAVAYFMNPGSPIEQEIGGWPDRVYSVAPYDTVDLAVILRAPEVPGVYTGFWLLANGTGEIVEPMIWTQIVVEESLEHEQSDWTGEWTIKDSYITIPVLVRGVLNKTESGQISGFFYDHKGDANLIDGWVTQDKSIIEGDYGEPRSKQGGIPFRWRMMDNHNQFQGVFWLGQLSANEICGSRYGYDLPEPCLLNE